MSYLDPPDYESFSLNADTPDGLVAMASALIEAHCRRTSLLAASYVERARLNPTRTARLSYGPLLDGAITAVRVRYNSTQPAVDFLGEIAQAFSLQGAWVAIDPATVDVYAGPGEIRLPLDLFGIGFAEAEITYTAGFVTVPDRLKAACAQIVRNAQATPALNVSKSRLDMLQVQYFAPTLLDADVQAMLKPYVAERLQ